MDKSTKGEYGKRGGDFRGARLPVMHDQAVLMSTPCQRAYAYFARLVTMKTCQCPWVWREKIRQIKGLARKSLKCISYWNRWGFGS